MKKLIFIITIFMSLLIFGGTSINANSIITSELQSTKDGGIKTVTCNATFCGILINPNVNEKIYSFKYTCGNLQGLYNKGIYHLKVNTVLNHQYEYRIIRIITQDGQVDYDVSQSHLSIDIDFKSDNNFYIEFINKVSTIKYSSSQPLADSFKNFSLNKIDSSENTFIKNNISGDLYSINNYNNSISTSPNNNLYSFNIYNTIENQNFGSGKYKISFNYILNSCYNNCNNYNYQRIILVGENNVIFNVNYNLNNYYEFEFESNNDFYIIIENKVNLTRNDDYPIDIFKNIKIENVKLKNTYLNIVESGPHYSVNNFNKSISVEPSTYLSYKFTIANGLANTKYEPGIYKLSFSFMLNSCANNCQDYQYNLIKIVTSNNYFEHDVIYNETNYLELEFNSTEYFYIVIENKVNFKRTDDFPLDTFSSINLLKEGEINDSENPVFSNYQGVYISNIESPTNIDYIKSLITATDDTDGNLTSSITIKEDNYTINIDKLGVYDVIFSVKDSSYNFAFLTISIHVIDLSPTIINGEDQILCSIKNGCYMQEEEFKIEYISNIINIEDNVDSDLLFDIEYDSWSNKENYYTNETYLIKISSTDYSYNKSEIFTIKINYIDDIFPYISEGLQFHTGTADTLSITKIKENITISDNFDNDKSITSRNGLGLLTLKEDNFSLNSNRVGKYYVKFDYLEYTFEVEINVYDNLPPVFYVDESILNIEHFNTLNHEQIINILKNINIIKDEPENYVFVTDQYTTNENISGKYMMSVELNYPNKEKTTIDFMIVVSNIEIEDEDEERNWFEKIILSISNFFKNIFKSISSFFKNFFN